MMLSDSYASRLGLALLCCAALGILTTQARAQSECDDVAGSGRYGQEWYAIDCEQYKKTMSGTIRALEWNTNHDGGFTLCPHPDGDWNIMVRPDDNRFLKNRSGTRNSELVSLPCGVTAATWWGSDDRKNIIELEVWGAYPNAGADLRRFFPKGTRVTANGYFVEDEGHESKTELHPLRWLRGGNEDEFAILVTQDGSERFADGGPAQPSDLAIDEWFHDIPLSSPGLTSSVSPQLPSERFASTGTVLGEEFWLDWVSAHRVIAGYVSSLDKILELVEKVLKGEKIDITYEGRFRTSAIAYPMRSGHLGLETNLMKPTHENTPMYLGHFRRGTAPVLRESLKYELISNDLIEGGVRIPSKRMVLTVKLQLVAPPPGILSGLPADNSPVAYSVWTYPTPTFGFEYGESHSEQDSGHSLEATLVYSPDIGADQAVWDFAVGGSTQQPLWTPSGSPPLTGSGGPFVRTHFADSRTFYVTPSAVELDTTPQKGSVHVAPSLWLSCTYAWNVSLSELLIPGIAKRDLQWRARLTRKSDGTDVEPASAEGQARPLAGPATGLERITVEFVSGDRVIVTYKNLGYEHRGGNGLYNDWYEPNNRAAAVVSVHVVTELGEELEAATPPLSLPACRQRVDPRVRWFNEFEQMDRLVVALEHLRQMGILPTDPPWPGSTLPLRKIRERFPRVMPRIAFELDEGEPLPAGAETLIALRTKLEGGGKLEKSDRDLLSKIANVSRQLPSLAPRGGRPMQVQESPTLSRSFPLARPRTEFPALKPGDSFPTSEVMFAQNSSRLTPLGRMTLLTGTARVRSDPRLQLEVRGFVDPARLESDSALVRARVEAIREYLLRAGVSASRVSVGSITPRTSQNGPEIQIRTK